MEVDFTMKVDLCFIDEHGSCFEKYCENKIDVFKFYKEHIKKADYYLLRTTIFNYTVLKRKDLEERLFLLSYGFSKVDIIPITKKDYKIFKIITNDRML
jgi:hypothetical protein